MPDERKNVKLQPEDHAELKRRKPDDKAFGEWLLEETADDGDDEDAETVEVSDEVIESFREVVREECGGSPEHSNDDLWGRLDYISDQLKGR